MPFVHIEKETPSNLLKRFREIEPGTLFVFEGEKVEWTEIKLRLDEDDSDGDPQYAYLYDGMIGSRSGVHLTCEVNLPVGKPYPT